MNFWCIKQRKQQALKAQGIITTLCHMGTLIPFGFSGDYALVNKQTCTIENSLSLSFSAQNTFYSELIGEFNEIPSFIKAYWIACYDHNKSSCITARINQHLSNTSASVEEISAAELYKLYFFFSTGKNTSCVSPIWDFTVPGVGRRFKKMKI